MLYSSFATISSRIPWALQPLGHRNSSQEIACEEWIEVGQIPAIVTKEQFEMVQAKLAHNQSFAKRNNTSHE